MRAATPAITSAARGSICSDNNPASGAPIGVERLPLVSDRPNRGGLFGGGIAHAPDCTGGRRSRLLSRILTSGHRMHVGSAVGVVDLSPARRVTLMARSRLRLRAWITHSADLVEREGRSLRAHADH